MARTFITIMRGCGHETKFPRYDPDTMTATYKEYIDAVEEKRTSMCDTCMDKYLELREKEAKSG